MATWNNSSSGVRIPLRDLDVKFIPKSKNLIGEGGFGQVYRAKYRDKNVAFKIPIEKASLPPNKRRVVEKEAEKLRASTHHKFIVTLYGVVIEDDPDIKGLVLEYMHFGSLTDFLAEYDVGVPLRIKFLQNILSAMKWLHSNNPPIRHLDLKAENILVNNYFDAKITDFGLSQWKTATTVNLSARNGTITHVPPEVFRDINKKGSVEEDVYAFGITAWEIFTGETPFQNCNPNMITNAVVNGQRPDVNKVTQECPQCPKHVVVMMQWCWEHNPMNRPSFQELEIKFVPVYNAVLDHLPVSIRYIRHQIREEHGVDSEKYKCTQHFETTLNDDNQTGVKVVSPVRNEGPVNGEILHREASLESTPRQDGLETNIERGLGDMSIMSPDGDRRSRLPGNQGQGQEYENNTGDYTNMSGLVSIKGQRYVPGHEIRHTKGYIAQPESTENSVNSNQNAQNHVDRPDRLMVGSQGEAGGKQVDIVVSMKTVAAARSESGAAKSQAADGGGIKGAEKQAKDGQDLSAQSKSAEDVFESGTKEMAGNIGDDEAIRRLSDTDPEIADTLLKSPDALKTFMMTRQSSTDVLTGHPLTMEDQPQRLTIHNGEKAVVSSGNTNIGRTTGVISADQQPSSFRDRDQRNQHYPAPVTYSNQTGAPIGLTSEGSQPAPNLMTMYTGVNRPQLNPGNLQNLPQHQPGSYGNANPQQQPGTYPNQPQLLPGTFQNQAQQQLGAYGAAHPQQYGAYGVANQPAPGTFDHNQRPLVQLPNTATRQSSVPSQVQFPPNTHMGSSTNPEEAVNRQVPEQSVLEYYNNMTGTSARTRDYTSSAVRMSASTVPTTQPQTEHSNTNSTRQTGNQPHEDRQDSGRNKKSGTTTQSVVTPKPNAIVIQHKHNDGALTSVNFDGSANMFPNVQIGNNMTMNVHRDSATQNIPRNNASSKKRSTECKKSDLTMSDQVPEVDTIDQVSVEVGADWKRLFRQLDISEPEIDQLQYDFHTGGLYEIIYQGLRMWKQKNGSEATVRKLALALWEIERSDIARKLK